MFGHFGAGNIGNDSTLEAALVNIQRLEPTASISCVCTAPAVVTARFGIEAVPVDIGETLGSRSRGLGVLARIQRLAIRGADEIAFWTAGTRWLRKADQFIVVGTGALDDMAVRPWNAPYDLFKWCHAAKQAGAKVIFLSVGAGPIKHPVSRVLMLRALRVANYRSYRDLPSLEYLKNLGVDTSRDHVYPDLAFSLPIRAPSIRKPAWPPTAVGLGVIGYYGWRHDHASGELVYQTYVRKLTRFMHWLLAKGYCVRLITGDLPTDQRPMEELLESVKASGRTDWRGRVSAHPTKDINDLCREIAAVDLVVATRFHNVLTALSLMRPVLSIGYHAKNDALMASMQLADYGQHIETLDVERLKSQFASLAARSERVIDHIQRTCVRYCERLENQYRRILAIRRYSWLDRRRGRQ